MTALVHPGPTPGRRPRCLRRGRRLCRPAGPTGAVVDIPRGCYIVCRYIVTRVKLHGRATDGRRRSGLVAAPPQHVFEALADPATWFIIDPTLVDVNPRERLALGTTGTMRNRRGPLTATATWTTTELIPGARLVQHLKDRLRAHGVGDALCGHARDAGDRRGLPHPHVVCRSAHGCDVTRDHGARSSGPLRETQGAARDERRGRGWRAVGLGWLVAANGRPWP